MTELRLIGDTSAFTLRRTLRDIRYIGFIVILPIIFYVMFTAIFAKNASVNDLAWSKYSLISMLSFGIVGNAINLLGTRIANERQDKWMDFIKVSPISSLYYNISFVITFLVISLLTMFLLFVTAFFWQGVTFSIMDYLGIAILLLLGSIPFLLFGVIVGYLGSAAQPVGTMLYLVLSFLGGLWMPVAAMPDKIQGIAKLLPTFSLASLGWNFLSNTSIVKPFIILFIYFICAVLVLAIIWKKQQKQ
jgi:ABC-2 type transport system permease protein